MESKCEEEYVTLAVQYSVISIIEWEQYWVGFLFDRRHIGVGGFSLWHIKIYGIAIRPIYLSSYRYVLYASAKGIWVDMRAIF